MKKKRKTILSVAAAALLVIIIWIIWGNSALTVNKITVTSEQLPKGFEGFRIAQISDLHNTEFGDNNSKLIEKLRQCNPDIILITGDLIDSRNTDIEIATSFAKQSSKIAPTYFVSGNHESRIEEYEDLLMGLENAGVTVLDNTAAEIEKSGASIMLIGVIDPDFQTDYLFETSQSTMERDLKNLISGDEGYTVLLSHRPELFDVYADKDINLVFSGHAHGGQIRLPFVGGIIAPAQGLFPKYDAGTYAKGDTTMVVSRGLGNSIFPFRVNNRPEIVVVELAREF